LSVQPETITALDIAKRIITAVCELPDRMSPEDWPEAMIVTDRELRNIVIDVVSPALAQRDEWLTNTNSAADQEASRYLAEQRDLEAERDRLQRASDAWREVVRLWIADILHEEVAADQQQWPMDRVRAWFRTMTAPIPMILHCPRCRLRHVDVDDETGKWATARFHQRHLCKESEGGCGLVFRVANVNTVGVRELPEVTE
jgi:hypothetical protein